MEEKTIYQTLEDRENPDQVENEGPFKCKHNNSWLGPGYYFWDSFINNAHWWGIEAHKGSYIICEAVFDFESNSCFDLVGSTKHLTEFKEALIEMKNRKLIKRDTFVVNVLNFLRTIGVFKYSAIRVNPINSQTKGIADSFKVNFVKNNIAHLEYEPPIQVCIFDLQAVNFRSYRIAYPEHYFQDDYML